MLGRKKQQPQGRRRVRANLEDAQQQTATRPPRPSTDTGRRRRLDERPIEDMVATSKPSKRAALRSMGRFWLRRTGLIILSVVAIISLVNILTLSSNPKVTVLGKDGAALAQPATVYQQAAAEVLAGSMLNRSKITVNTAAVSRELEQQFPELSKVTVSIPFVAHRPVIYVEAADPGLLLVANNGTFLLDTQGNAVLRVAENDSRPVLSKLVHVKDESGLQLSEGEQALPADSVAFVREIVAQLAAKDYAVESIVLPPASNQLTVRLAGQAYTVLFNMQRDTARQQAGTFLATIAYLKKQNTPPAQYIDVRLDGRAYYQ